MDFNHVYDLHHLLSGRRTPLPLNDILSQLEVERATFYRIRGFMIDCLGAPIKVRKGQGYCYDSEHGEQYELPGLWFSAQELIALSLLEQLLESLQPVIVKELLEPVRNRMRQLIEAQGIEAETLQKRLRILPQWQRPCDTELFIRISQALLQRRRLDIEYQNRHDNSCSKRTISPQQLIYYRDNWYLDGWCHLRQALRTFSLDAIKKARMCEQAAAEIPSEKLAAHYQTSYGIFAGEPTAVAVLEFSQKVAGWVSKENWHPEQKEEWTTQGGYRLTLPYNDPRELVRDIMRYGADVEVLAPKALRSMVKEQLKQALEKYT